MYYKNQILKSQSYIQNLHRLKKLIKFIINIKMLYKQYLVIEKIKVYINKTTLNLFKINCKQKKINSKIKIKINKSYKALKKKKNMFNLKKIKMMKKIKKLKVKQANNNHHATQIKMINYNLLKKIKNKMFFQN